MTESKDQQAVFSVLGTRYSAPSDLCSPCHLVTLSPGHLVIRIAACLLAALILAIPGQASPHPPADCPAPLLYVRFVLPDGGQVTFYQPAPAGSEFPAPVTVGLRPGYLYRVQLSHFREHPDLALFPSLEVRGTLHLPPNLRAADSPAPVVITDDDIALALAGGFVTKVVYVENPERAEPVATRPDRPVEITLRPDQNPIEEARAFGRPVLIVRLGARTLSAAEMAQQAIPGTMLLPGQEGLGLPPVPPCIPWACLPMYDPILGPRPAEEECMHDGGDVGAPAGLDPQGRLRGLDPSDTVAVYTDYHGQKHLAISNRVCLCVPRYGIVTVPIAPAGYESYLALGRAQAVVEQAVLRTKLPPVEVRQRQQLVAVGSRERPSATVAAVGTVPVAQIQGRAVVIGILHERTITGICVPKIPPAPARPLVLCKTADKQGVQIGDIVTFTLKYTNTGGQPITGVVVSDSLTGRLEYVSGSAKTDREAVFTTQPNEAGSLILRWEIAGTLLPGTSGVIRFQTRVR
jgi:uncharacterized repeat protein (TIGR01451 family)